MYIHISLYLNIFCNTHRKFTDALANIHHLDSFRKIQMTKIQKQESDSKSDSKL